MLKKAGVVMAGVVAALTLLSFTKYSSYTCTAWKSIRDEASKQVSIEFEIRRLKTEVAQLDPDINRNRTIVAEEIVAVDKLRNEVDGARKKLTQLKEQVGRVAAELKAGAASVVYDGQDVTASRAKEKLDRDVNNGQAFESALKSKERQLDARERLLTTSKKKLQAMADAKSELLAQIAQLEADYQEVQLQATQSRVQFDDSRLADIKRSLDDLRDRVKVQKVKQDLEGGDTTATEDKTKTGTEVIRRAEEFSKPGTDESKIVTDQK
jgi:chromosome segregation ATPase